MSSPILDPSKIWKNETSKEALNQIADICQKTLLIEVKKIKSGSAFCSIESNKYLPAGIHHVIGEIIDDVYISVKLELAHVNNEFRGPLKKIFDELAKVGKKVSLIAPPEKVKGQSSLWVEIKADANPLSPVRAAPFVKQIAELSDIAKSIQEQLPVITHYDQLMALFEDYKDVVSPVFPLKDTSLSLKHNDIVSTINNYLTAACCVAISSAYPIISDYFLSMIATLLREKSSDRYLCLLTQSAIKSRNLLELVQKIPFIPVVSAEQLSFGTIAYEMNNEITSLLRSLLAINKPCVFVGTHSKLQSIFSGGQLAANDPLMPVVVHLPDDVSEDLLIDFSLEKAARETSGLSIKAKSEISNAIHDNTAKLSKGKMAHILPFIANSGMNLWNSMGCDGLKDLEVITHNLRTSTETLSGLGRQVPGKRDPEIQEHFIKSLTAPDLLPFLKANLFGQDAGIEKAVKRLATETVARPSNQPIRICIVGTPATGKSETAALIARYLSIPYENIDASAFSNSSMANTQLFGSGPGYVDSNKIPRLMQIASHHQGCVLEISDLDHASLDVRMQLAENFLQILQTGRAQSGFGSTFSCSSIIFIFTLNLPDGADEKLSRKLGFGGNPSRKEMAHAVESELKKFFSGAFLSRIGQPVLYTHLSKTSLACIIEKNINNSIRTASENIFINIKEIKIAPHLGAHFISSKTNDIIAFGARRLEDLSRELAANAFLAFVKENCYAVDAEININVCLSSDGNKILIQPY